MVAMVGVLIPVAVAAPASAAAGYCYVSPYTPTSNGTYVYGRSRMTCEVPRSRRYHETQIRRQNPLRQWETLATVNPGTYEQTASAVCNGSGTRTYHTRAFGIDDQGTQLATQTSPAASITC